MKKIALGCDHGGLDIKNAVRDYLESEKIAYTDFGTFNTDSVDYPEFAFLLFGEDIPEDMTIPMFFHGEMFEAGKAIEHVSLLDLAPTIADIMQVPYAREWEGKSLVK